MPSARATQVRPRVGGVRTQYAPATQVRPRFGGVRTQYARATKERPEGRRGPVFGDVDRRVLQRKAWVPEGRRSVRPSPKRTCPCRNAYHCLERRV
jgi:hypothetical protein